MAIRCARVLRRDGELAYKKICPALQAMGKRGPLDVPVIGVAKAGWGVDELRARARDSVEQYGGLDAAAFDKLYGMLEVDVKCRPRVAGQNPTLGLHA